MTLRENRLPRHWLRCVAAFIVILWCGLLTETTTAHEATLVDLRVREVAPGDFVWTWSVGARGRPVAEELTLHWPEHCEVRGQAMRCGSTGLTGEFSIDGVGELYSAVIVRLSWYNGINQVVTLTQSMTSTRLYSGGRDTRGWREIANAYGVLGVEHILSGWDHLLFVVSLLLLVGFNRQLIATVSAFTVAHSLTLAASAFGLLTLRPAPVEATIALSIVLVASECLNPRPTISRKWPALVAFLFGLVHGLGFAGALKEIGLPPDHMNLALLIFNLGVECGQLLVLAAIILLVRLLGRALDRASDREGRVALLDRSRRAVIYGIGIVSVYWTISRIATMVLDV